MRIYTQIAKFMGTNMGPAWVHVGPRWALCWPHEPCYQGRDLIAMVHFPEVTAHPNRQILTLYHWSTGLYVHAYHKRIKEEIFWDNLGQYNRCWLSDSLRCLAIGIHILNNDSSIGIAGKDTSIGQPDFREEGCQLTNCAISMSKWTFSHIVKSSRNNSTRRIWNVT